MSNIDLIIEERPARIGDFLVGRLLPFRKKRHVGPFVFIDHMGPAELDENTNLDVPPHPHIGLSTLTFLFEGNVVHRDSLGTEVEISPGAVNWMSAGKGIVHSERTPEYLRGKKKKVHGLQIWVALPRDLEEMEPRFSHTEAGDIPSWEQNDLKIKLIAGKVLGKESPVPVHSDLYFLEVKAYKDQEVDLGHELYGESAIYILEGEVHHKGNTFGPKQILVARENTLCKFEVSAGTTIYIFGGHPFEEERHIHWNFVSSSKERIDKAREDWKNQRFPKIPGDDAEFVPLPQ
ncbi:MAG: pirin family protein [Brumimicrobium sp.]|nr:pirin family protein [Brumimicrobium sp.]